MITELNKDNYFDFINQDGDIIIMFFSDECGFYCEKLFFDNFSKTELMIGRINIESGLPVCNIVKYKQIMPVFAKFNSGALQEMIIGFHYEAGLKEKLKMSAEVK